MPTRLYHGLAAVAALLMAVATGLGAWASHGLESTLDADALHAFETAVSYQFVHALGLFGICLYAGKRGTPKAVWLAALIVLGGIVLFCGGVYASSLGGPRWISSLAPAGGIALIAGWLLFGTAALLVRPSS